MVTIYFDKQVFSYLFNTCDEKYIRLKEKILAHKEEFILLYSAGHLMDLNNDMSEKKYAEMEFMHSIVDENFLIFDSYIKVSRISPMGVFLNLGEPFKKPLLDNLDLSNLSKEQKKALNNISDLIRRDIDEGLEFDWLKTRVPIDSEELLVDKETLEYFFNVVSESFFGNKYKMVRDNVMHLYNPGSIVTGESGNVNDVSLNTPLKMMYLDIVRAALKQIGFPVNNDLMTYYISYVFLDLFGFNKEPRKKVKFQNLQADALHSFYGSYCDCVVSDDVGLRNKTKDLYGVYNINTKVYSVDEFIEKFDEAIANNKKSIYQYWEEIMQDYLYGEEIKSETVPDGKMIGVKCSYSYFGYFNQMFVKESDGETAIILCKNLDTNNFILIKEIEILVNRYARAFNEIGAQFCNFNWELEFTKILADSWSREVRVNNMLLKLTRLPGTPKFCFSIWIKKDNTGKSN